MGARSAPTEVCRLGDKKVVPGRAKNERKKGKRKGRGRRGLVIFVGLICVFAMDPNLASQSRSLTETT